VRPALFCVPAELAPAAVSETARSAMGSRRRRSMWILSGVCTVTR
jgi:hypothetical protein